MHFIKNFLFSFFLSHSCLDASCIRSSSASSSPSVASPSCALLDQPRHRVLDLLVAETCHDHDVSTLCFSTTHGV